MRILTIGMLALLALAAPRVEAQSDGEPPTEATTAGETSAEAQAIGEANAAGNTTNAENSDAEPNKQTPLNAEQQHSPEPIIEDPHRAAREKAWTARCKPQLVAAADGMQRYVYAHADCTGRELN